jgi:hypothetical protein
VRALAALAAVVAGVLSGAAGTVLHQTWWGLALGLGTALVVLACLPPGGVRLAFALGWCLPVLRGVLAKPAGGFLVGADAMGWSFVAGTLVLLVAALATVRSGAARRGATVPGSAGDPGERGPSS